MTLAAYVLAARCRGWLAVGVILGAALVSACAASTSSGAALTANPALADVRVLYLGNFGPSPSARDMREAMREELMRSTWFTLTESADAADAELTGIIGLEQSAGPVTGSPHAMVTLRLRATGAIVWESTYRDQRSGTEFATTAMQMLRTVARQFSSRLHSEAGAPRERPGC